MIVKEVPIRKAGRRPKYDFANLTPGDCLKIPAVNTDKHRNIMTALLGFKQRNKLNWETTTRFDNGIVSVYRLK